MARCLVTGGAGFIGSHLVDALLQRGHDVRVVDDFSSGRRENLEHALHRIELIEADLRDPDVCRHACRDIDIVFHQAAVPSVPRSVADPLTTHDANVNATFHLLLAARDARVRRFIYAASSSAYGETDAGPKSEALTPRPLSPYAVSKLAGEHYARVFHLCYGLETLSLRYFNVFGPRQDPQSEYAAAIPRFITAILRGEPPTIFGDGQQTRDFTYIDNAVHANLLAATTPHADGTVLNVGCGRSISVNEIVATISRILGSSVTPRHTDPRPGDIRHSQADISLARRHLGYEPLVDFEEGLRRTIDWFAARVA